MGFLRHWQTRKEVVALNGVPMTLANPEGGCVALKNIFFFIDSIIFIIFHKFLLLCTVYLSMLLLSMVSFSIMWKKVRLFCPFDCIFLRCFPFSTS